MSDRLALIGLLAVLGASWGATQPLAKVAVSTGHGAFGLIFWQLVIGIALFGLLTALRGRGLPLGPQALVVYLVIALVGTLFPNSASYEAARHLPAGVLSITIALVPMMAFPLALALGVDRYSVARLAGLLLGLLGVVLIAAPKTSLPEVGMVAWLPLALIAPFFYAVEGNYVARWGTASCDPIQTLLGASIVGSALILPVTLATGQWIDPLQGIRAPEAALIASSVLHALAYAGYVWLIGRSGAVFAAQISYLVTGFGVLWAILFLGESYSGWVWLALVAMMGGLFLVQPRPREAIAAAAHPVKDGA